MVKAYSPADEGENYQLVKQGQRDTGFDADNLTSGSGSDLKDSNFASGGLSFTPLRRVWQQEDNF